MNYLLLILLVFFQFSCTQNTSNYNEVILENDTINTVFLESLDEAEKALISGYLFAYGNECDENLASKKCELLRLLHIDNECEKIHVFFLKNWFSKDVIMQHKLQTCPNMPRNFAIQNSFEKITLNRIFDTISITIKVKGINESQEKNWEIEQTTSYIIKNNVFLKI